LLKKKWREAHHRLKMMLKQVHLQMLMLKEKL
jgi:hypothetical protein